MCKGSGRQLSVIDGELLRGGDKALYLVRLQ